jgi:hypothetical protein
MTDASPLELVSSGSQEIHEWMDAIEVLLAFLDANHLSPDSDAIPEEMVDNAGDGNPLPDLSWHLDYMINLLSSQCALAERHPQLERLIAQALERVIQISDRWLWMILEHNLG